MAQHFKIHPDNPQHRLIKQAAVILREGGVIAYPTDSCYALGCLLADAAALARIQSIRGLKPGHLFTLICRDLSGISGLARIENSAFRLIKSLTPGPYTFILKATREVPRRLQEPKRRTIGLRIPDNRICQELLKEIGEPLLSTSLVLVEGDGPEGDPELILEKIGSLIDLVIDAGATGSDMTTIIDLSGSAVQIVRRGKGDVSRI
jgi:tRNA threonylcarbamoyl adenosine modification protein (Sua5/YciO/YrdC/YwlC family)